MSDLQQSVINEDGERVIPGTRRPDGTWRKERRVRDGFTPQEEQVVYKPEQVMVRQGAPQCPGMDDAQVVSMRALLAQKAMTKAQKKNEKRKQQRKTESAATAAPGSRNGSSKAGAAGDSSSDEDGQGEAQGIVKSLAAATISALNAPTPGPSSASAATDSKEAAVVTKVNREKGAKRLLASAFSAVTRQEGPSTSSSPVPPVAASPTPPAHSSPAPEPASPIAPRRVASRPLAATALAGVLKQDSPAAVVERQARNLRKKIRQCDALLERQRQGHALATEEAEKLQHLPAWSKELEELEAQVTAS